MIELLHSMLSEQLSYAISWTVLHSLWQASLIALIMSWYLNICRNDDAIIRYRITYASLLFVFISAVSTFCYYYYSYGGHADVVIQQVMITQNATAVIIQEEVGVLSSITKLFTGNFTLIASMWLMGALLFSLKFGGSFIFANNLKKGTSSLLSDSTFKQFLKLKKEIGVNRYVQVAESAKINTPVLIGYLRPVILFPVGLINQLSIEETNAILAHELAHVKRNDFIHNLFISVLETLFYYHPAVWWISANLRLERENCCDDLAVRTIGDKAIYAKTLVKIDSLKQTKIPGLAIPMARNSNQLLHRISRIVNQPQTRSQIREKLIAVLLLFTFFFGFGHTSINENDRHISIVPEMKAKPIALVTSDCAGKQQLLTKQISNLKHDCNCDNKISELKVNVTSGKVENRNVIYIDTIPTSKKSNMTIINSGDDQEVVLKMKDGKITELRIDGEEIDENDYDKHLEHENLDLEEIVKDATDQLELLTEEQLMDLEGTLETDVQGILEGLNFDINILEDKLQNSFSFEHHDSLFNREGRLEWENFDLNINMDSVLNELQIRIGDTEKLRFKLLDSMQHNFHDSLYSGIFEMRSDFPNQFEGFDNFEIRGTSDFFSGKERSSNPTDALISALKKDGFILDNGKQKIELTGKYLKINGQKQPDNIFNKYKKIFENQLGHELSKDSKIKIETD